MNRRTYLIVGGMISILPFCLACVFLINGSINSGLGCIACGLVLSEAWFIAISRSGCSIGFFSARILSDWVLASVFLYPLTVVIALFLLHLQVDATTTQPPPTQPTQPSTSEPPKDKTSP